jgi:hypothetical protein
LIDDDVIGGKGKGERTLKHEEHDAELEDFVRRRGAIGVPRGQQPGMGTKQDPAVEQGCDESSKD